MFENKDWNQWYDSDDFDVASTTMIGMFASGATPEGACDLAGNVWEWTASSYDEQHIERVLRGGSWDSRGRLDRCAYRFKLVPVSFNSHVGFRLLSPGIFPGSGS